MKKGFDNDLGQKHGNEFPKKLYRTITDQSKRLDEARGCARRVRDLFHPNLVIRRRKFCDYCERLIFIDPRSFGRKTEELLWRKVFYDVVSAAKKLKNASYTVEELCNVQNHIRSGIGFYHHFIAKIRSDFGGTSTDHMDFAAEEAVENRNYEEYQEWVEEAIHRSLIYLGDLCRYNLEMSTTGNDNLTIRYYSQAIFLKPDNGMPHNQMGTLAMNLNRSIDAVYHYLRGLDCKNPFDGTSNNLITLFDKNSKFLEQLPVQNDNDEDCVVLPSKSDLLKRFSARFLLLIDIWYFNKTVPKVHDLCHLTFKDLNECLNFDPNEENSLKSDTLFKITIICVLCHDKVKSKTPQQTSIVTAFVIAFYSHLIRKVCNQIEESVANFPITELKRKKVKGAKVKVRRRRKSTSDSESSNDESEASASNDESSSDQENLLVESSEEEDNVNEKREPTHEQTILHKMKKIDINHVIEIISEENRYLQCIKLVNDWLMLDSAILKSCGSNSKTLIKQIGSFLNLTNIDAGNPKTKLSGIERRFVYEKIPLSEDIIVKGLNLFENNAKAYDWSKIKKRNLTAKEETLNRVLKFQTFGRFVAAIPESGLVYKEKKKIYVCNDAVEEDAKSNNDAEETVTRESPQLINGHSKDGQLVKMKHMGQLWLASEVSALENRVKGKSSLSPYLVLDADCLIKYTFMVKHLVNSRKFIVLVPNAVVSALDDVKKEKTEARDAIRWLENQFHRGNRFFRAQRPQERMQIPFVKYPKKKDKEMYTYIQIIECCYYLTEQQKGAANLITLLIGNTNLLSNGENKEFSYMGLAQSIGITIETIAQFYAKSKKSSKDNR